MPDHDFRCGDFVRCTSKYYAEQLNIVGHIGIVMGTKPSHIHVWFETQKRSFWINADILRRAEDVSSSPLLQRIQTLAYALDAEEWELEEPGDSYKLICYVNEITFETLQEIRHYLDIDYQSLTMGPEGMGRMLTTVQWAR